MVSLDYFGSAVNTLLLGCESCPIRQRGPLVRDLNTDSCSDVSKADPEMTSLGKGIYQTTQNCGQGPQHMVPGCTGRQFRFGQIAVQLNPFCGGNGFHNFDAS